MIAPVDSYRAEIDATLEDLKKIERNLNTRERDLLEVRYEHPRFLAHALMLASLSGSSPALAINHLRYDVFRITLPQAVELLGEAQSAWVISLLMLALSKSIEVLPFLEL